MKDAEARRRVHSDELRAALECVLTQYFGTRRRVKKLHRRLSAYSSSYTIEYLSIEFDRGPALHLVLKDVSPSSVLSTAQQIRPHFLYDPAREARIYQNVLRPQKHGTAICYGAVASPELERHWIFLERVRGTHLWQIGRMESWEEAARWLARLHGEFSGARPLKKLSGLQSLLQYDEEFFRIWRTRAEEFLRYQSAAHSREARRRFARLVARYERVVKRLSELPLTLVHGEFYPSNLIVRHAGNSHPICALDWEVTGIAPGVLDLAALISGKWSEAEKLRMVQAYHAALRGKKPALKDLLEAVEFAQLHLSVQLLGWATDWSPPAHHAHNWLQTALRLAEKLKICKP